MHEIGLFKISEGSLEFLCRQLPWYLLIIWLIYSSTMLVATKYFQKNRITNYYVLELF